MKIIEMNNKKYRVYSIWETASGGLANAEFQLKSGKWAEVKNIQIRIELAKLYKQK